MLHLSLISDAGEGHICNSIFVGNYSERIAQAVLRDAYIGRNNFWGLVREPNLKEEKTWSFGGGRDGSQGDILDSGQGLILALYSGITSGSPQRTICGDKDQTQVEDDQGKQISSLLNYLTSSRNIDSVFQMLKATSPLNWNGLSFHRLHTLYFAHKGPAIRGLSILLENPQVR